MKRQLFPLSEKEAKNKGVEYFYQDNKDAKFPSLLRNLRKGKGISQQKLADEIGVTKSTVGLYETGDTVPDVKTLYKIAKYYDVSSDYLLGLADNRKYENIDIGEKLGLTDGAIEALREINRKAVPDNFGGKNNRLMDTINLLLESESGYNVFSFIGAYFYQLETDLHSVDVHNVPAGIDYQIVQDIVGLQSWGAAALAAIEGALESIRESKIKGWHERMMEAGAKGATKLDEAWRMEQESETAENNAELDMFLAAHKAAGGEVKEYKEQEDPDNGEH